MSGDAISGEEKVEAEALRRRVAELEDALGRTERLLQTIIDHLPAVVYVRDTDWRFTIVNQITADYYGGRDRTIGKRDVDLVPQNVVDGWRVNDEKAVTSGKRVDIEESAPMPDGMHYYHTTKFPVFDHSGKLFAVGGVSVDFTTQRRAEERLREREKLLQSILLNAPMFIYAVDPDGVFTFAEGKGLKTTGLDSSQLVGRSIFDVWRNRPALLDRVREAFAGKPANTIEEFDKRALETWHLPVRDAERDANSLIGVALDVTDRRRAEIEQSVQAQVIAAQRAAIRELSTPLIPLTDDAVVMPLIGSLDSLRAQQFMEVLLQGVSARNARVVIVDVTGVSTVDTRVADALIKAAKAVRLLGARVIMTGISSQIAQTLVGLGINFDEITIYGSLQVGVAQVLKMAQSKPKGQ